MPKHISTRQLGYFLIILGIVTGAVAVLLFIRQQHQPTVAPASTSQGAPSSTKPSSKAVAEYKVAPDLPKYITIPAIKVNQARIFGMGVSANGEIATPGNINDTGWYKASSKPGQAGAMFIFGHVSSWQANGIFHDLKKLRPGDSITITRGDNQTFTYRVSKSASYPVDQVDMNSVLAPIDPSKPGLNLMTCDGKLIKGTNNFTNRFVVFASLSG